LSKQEEHLILDIKNTFMPLETTTAIPNIQPHSKRRAYMCRHNRHYRYHKVSKEMQTFKHLGKISYL
jgi:hypothetical protein